MHFKKSAQGAVSVFLVIILVPMMALSALFVDLSRIKLAREMAVTATELTLNTALTDYDRKLKELYGLLATAKSPKDLEAELQGYYTSCITSAGIDKQSAGDIVDQLMAAFGMTEDADVNIADFMKVEVAPDSFKVGQLEAGSITNPMLVKRQIVEFMKYRSPINTGLRFINALKSFKTLSKQTKLVENRRDYYEKEKNLAETLKKAWGNIHAYDKAIAETQDALRVIGDLYAENAQNGSSTMYDVIMNAHRDMVKSLYKYSQDSFYYCDLNKGTVYVPNSSGTPTQQSNEWVAVYGYNRQSVEMRSTVNEYYAQITEDNSFTANMFRDLIAGLLRERDDYYAKYATHNDFYNSLTNPAYYRPQVILQAKRLHELDLLTQDAMNIYSAYHQLWAQKIWAEEHISTDNDDDEGGSSSSSVLDTTITILGYGTKTVRDFFSEAASAYSLVLADFSDVAKFFNNQFNAVSPTFSQQQSTLWYSHDDRLVEYGERATIAYTSIRNAGIYLSRAKNLLTSARVQMDELNNKLKEWKGNAEHKDLKDAPLAKQDLAEIEELQSKFTLDDMDDLSNKISSVWGKLSEIVVDMQNATYHDVPMHEISYVSYIQSLLSSNVGDNVLFRVPLEEANISSVAISSEVLDINRKVIDVSWHLEQETSPVLDDEDTQLPFHKYLEGRFGDIAIDAEGNTTGETEDEDNGENLYNGIKNVASETSGDAAPGTGGCASPSGNELKDSGGPSKDKGLQQENDTSEYDKGGPGNTTNSQLSVLEKIGEFMVGLMDNLYVADYIMSMFSFDTVAKEAETKDIEGGPVTLTQKAINADNNWAYGREVEYILYGGSNSHNVTVAYASIYGIRLGFNLIYAFMDSSIRESALAIAIPISAATLGVIPAPLIQAAIIIGLACIESAVDLLTLKDGEAVPVFKTQKTWTCSFRGLVNVAREKLAEEGKKLAIAASNKLVDEGLNKLNELLDMTDEQLNAAIDGGAVKIEEYVGNAYDTMIRRHANTAIQKLTTVAIEALQKAEVGKITDQQVVSYIEQKLRDWVSKLDSSDNLAHMAIETAVNVIIENNVIEGLCVRLVELGATGKLGNIGETLSEMLEGNEFNPEGVILDAQGGLMGIINSIREDIMHAIEDGAGRIKQYKTQMIEQIQSAAGEGAGKLKETLQNGINGVFDRIGGGGNGGGGGDNTGIASLLSFRYSDYLRLFLLIKLIDDDSAQRVLYRMEDAIQMNLRKVNNEEGYKLANKVAYVDLSVDLMVKPILVPIFGNIIKNPETNSKWYKIDEYNVKGY